MFFMKNFLNCFDPSSGCLYESILIFPLTRSYFSSVRVLSPLESCESMQSLNFLALASPRAFVLLKSYWAMSCSSDEAKRLAKVLKGEVSSLKSIVLFPKRF
tara:strand:+ start:268 stop:573 length:306 start_codon:yes stop_codon:yes gene_type:complete